MIKNSSKEVKKQKDLVYGLAGLSMLASIEGAVSEKMVKEGIWDIIRCGPEQAKGPLVLQLNFLRFLCPCFPLCHELMLSP